MTVLLEMEKLISGFWRYQHGPSKGSLSTFHVIVIDVVYLNSLFH